MIYDLMKEIKAIYGGDVTVDIGLTVKEDGEEYATFYLHWLEESKYHCESFKSRQSLIDYMYSLINIKPDSVEELSKSICKEQL